MSYQVLLFYKYVTIENPKELMGLYRMLCEKYALKGRTIIAEEGINSTLEGTVENTEAFSKQELFAAQSIDGNLIKTARYVPLKPGEPDHEDPVAGLTAVGCSLLCF